MAARYDDENLENFSTRLAAEAGEKACSQFEEEQEPLSEQAKEAMQFATDYTVRCSVPFVAMKLVVPLKREVRMNFYLLSFSFLILLAFGIFLKNKLPSEELFVNSLCFIIPVLFALAVSYLNALRVAKRASQSLQEAKWLKENLDRPPRSRTASKSTTAKQNRHKKTRRVGD